MLSKVPHTTCSSPTGGLRQLVNLQQWECCFKLVAASVVILLCCDSDVLAQQPVAITFSNTTQQPLQMFWVDEQQKEVDYGAIPAAGRVEQETLPGHTWRFRAGGQLVGTYVVNAQSGATIDLGKLALAGASSGKTSALSQWKSARTAKTLSRAADGTWQLNGAETITLNQHEVGGDFVVLQDPRSGEYHRFDNTAHWMSTPSNEWQQIEEGKFVTSAAGPAAPPNGYGGYSTPGGAATTTGAQTQARVWRGTLGSPPMENPPSVEIRSDDGQRWTLRDSKGYSEEFAGAEQMPDGSLFLFYGPQTREGLKLENTKASVMKDGGNGNLYSTTWYNGSWVTDGAAAPGAAATGTLWTADPGSPTGFSGSFRKSPNSDQWTQLDGQGNPTGETYRGEARNDGSMVLMNNQPNGSHVLLRADAASIIRFDGAGQSSEVSLANGRWAQ